MKVSTTFWSKEVYYFNELLYINNRSDEIIFRTDLHNKQKTLAFFKAIIKFMKTKRFVLSMRNLYLNKANDCYQFAVMFEGNIVPITWFNLEINKEIKISHDVAFETTLIKRNNVQIPFGKFAMNYKNKTLPIFREFKIKIKVYKFILNVIHTHGEFN